MLALINRYFALASVSLLVAPLWLNALSTSGAPALQALRDASIWTAIFFAGLLLIKKLRGYQVRGVWRRPTKTEMLLYAGLLMAVLLVDYGSKLLFFQNGRPEPVEVVRNFGLHSVFHETAFEPFHVYVLFYFVFLFFFGALFFRFSARLLDRVWLTSAAFTLGGTIALLAERLMFGGVHNSFYFAGPLMWVCPTCASPLYRSYAWTPADLFVHAVFVPVFVLIASYFWPPHSTSLHRSHAPDAIETPAEDRWKAE